MVDETEDRFAAFLRRSAAGYHRPPPTPREEIWARVEADWSSDRDERGTRESDALSAAVDAYHPPPETPREEIWAAVRAARGPAPPRVSPEAGRGRGSSWRWGLALAATLLVGIVLGRGTSTLPGPSPEPTGSLAFERGEASPDASAREAEESAARPAAPGPRSGAEGAAAEAGDGAPEAPGGRAGMDGEERAAPLPDRAAGGEVRAPERGIGGEPSAGRESAEAPALRAATLAHLGRTEALLTGFRASGASASDLDPGSWARDLLGDTRLLLDWSAGGDPHLVALLEELELVLAQIARLEAGSSEEERALVVEGLERRGVLTLLRATVPPGDETRAPARGL